MKKKRFVGLFLVFMLVFQLLPFGSLNAFANSHGDYQSGSSSIPVTAELESPSTNTHTLLHMVWTNGDTMYLSVKSTHKLQYAEFNKVRTDNKDVYEALKEISINDTYYTPKDGFNANTNSAHWTVFKFNVNDLGITSDGGYPIFIKGIGGGHYVNDTIMITVPKVTINGVKKWIDGPMTSVDIQLYRQISEHGEKVDVGDPINLTTANPTFERKELPYTDVAGRIHIYGVKEIDPGTGYTVSYEIEVIKDENNLATEYKFEITNTYASPRIDIEGEKKWDDEGYNRPESITVVLLQNEVNIAEKTVAPNESGKWLFVFEDYPATTASGVPYDYAIDELDVAGYRKSIDNMTITNTVFRGDIEVLKYDDNENLLSGAEFTLFQGEEIMDVQVTDEDGYLIFEDVPYGSYQVKETRAPAGFVASEVIKNASIETDGQLISFEFFNDTIMGEITILKVDSDTETPLAGAFFEIRNHKGIAVYDDATNAYGEIVVDLPFGDYVVEEITAPEGYVILDEEVPFSIETQGQELSFTFENRLIRGDIEIVKYDDKENLLSGAEFTLFQGEEVIELLLTDEEGYLIFENVPYGIYFVQETKAPVGFVASDIMKDVTIDEDGQLVSLEFFNDTIIGEVIILKVDSDTEEPLAGAVFEIRDGEGTFVFEGTTDEEGLLVVNLPFGDYVIEEIEAPEGYIGTEELFDISIETEGQMIELIVQNTLIPVEEIIDEETIPVGTPDDEIIDDETIPVGIPDDHDDEIIDDETIPVGSPHEEDEIILDEPVPVGSLPRTGQGNPLHYYLLGSLIIAMGVLAKKYQF